MAISKVKKVEIIAITEHKEKLMSALQDFSNIEIIDTANAKDQPTKLSEEETGKIQNIDLAYANTDFAIKVLTPYAPKKPFMSGPITLSEKEISEKASTFKYNEFTEQCYAIEEKMNKAKNDLSYFTNEYKAYLPWKALKTEVKNLEGTDSVGMMTGTVKSTQYDELRHKLEELSPLIGIEKVSHDEKNTYLSVYYNSDHELEKEIKGVLTTYKFAELDSPKTEGTIKDYCHDLHEQIKESEKAIAEQKHAYTKLAKQMDDLKVTHDYFSWQKDKLESLDKLINTDYSFVIHGWVPTKKVKELEETIAKVTNEFAVNEIEPAEGEVPPIIIANPNLVTPFETITKMYGLPKYNGLDPTPYLSVFFIVFFALCLTDAGYGIVMFIVMALALKFVKLGDGAKKLVKLLMYGGIATTIIGALFGGWFGFLPEEAPGFLTYTAANGETLFLLQRINSITDPITVLVISLALGYLQLTFGVFIKFAHEYIHGSKLDAILDSGTWAFLLTGIAFFILTATGVLPASLGEVGKWWVILGMISLVLTQGRTQKNPIMKLLSGILSLYGLVGYMSDVLSYSRLLALGLATAIIALAVNVIVGLAASIPYVGWLLAIVIFIGGHILNLLINALGSFIHAGRLQFVEFFGKFMEAGGTDFRPLDKKNKYVFIKNN